MYGDQPMTTADRPEEKGFDLENTVAIAFLDIDHIFDHRISDQDEKRIKEILSNFGRRCFDQGIERAAECARSMKNGTTIHVVPTTEIPSIVAERILALKGGGGKG